jgi:hypothetical protein
MGRAKSMSLPADDGEPLFSFEACLSIHQGGATRRDEISCGCGLCQIGASVEASVKLRKEMVNKWQSPFQVSDLL